MGKPTAVSISGGLTAQHFLHPSTTPFERLFRRKPNAGFVSSNLSPNNPFTFELGAYQVPQNMTLFILDARPDVYRPRGIVPGDSEPVPERSLSNILGFSITVDQKTQGNVDFFLEPAPIVQSSSLAFGGGTGLTNQVQTVYGPVTTPFQSATTVEFADADAGSFAATGGPGIALQPQRQERYGSRDIPFTLYAQSGQTVQVKCIVWRPIPIPIAFVEYSFSGLLIPQHVTYELIKAVDYPRADT